MNTPYHPHPDNTPTLTDDSSGWETALQPKRLTFARIAALHELAILAANNPNPRMPAIFDDLPLHESDIFALEFFKARIRLTHPAHPPGHTTPISGPGATLDTIEHIRPYLEHGTALFATSPLAIAVDKTRLLASQDPQAEINAAIGWLRAFALSVLPIKPSNPSTTSNPPAQPVNHKPT